MEHQRPTPVTLGTLGTRLQRLGPFVRRRTGPTSPPAQGPPGSAFRLMILAPIPAPILAPILAPIWGPGPARRSPTGLG